MYARMISYAHAMSGLLSSNVELLAFANRLCAPKILDHLSVASHCS